MLQKVASEMHIFRLESGLGLGKFRVKALIAAGERSGLGLCVCLGSGLTMGTVMESRFFTMYSNGNCKLQNT